VPQLGQLLGQLAGGLGRPPQRRLRITPRIGLHQFQQRLTHTRIGLGHPLTPTTGTASPAQWLAALLQIRHALGDRRRTHPSRPRDQLDPAMAQRSSFSTQQQAPLPLVQMRQHRSELARQGLLKLHRKGHGTSMTDPDDK
jgi:hypothetical protein